MSAALAELDGWYLDDDGRLARTFEFADFTEAWAFMSRVALLAEKHDHHPDWCNSWNRVEVAFTNHEAGGLTELDVAMARQVHEL